MTTAAERRKQLERYDQLGREIDLDRGEVERMNAEIAALQSQRETIADKLAEAAETDDELIRWSTTAPGMQKLTATLTGLHVAIVGATQWKRTQRANEDGHVWLMPELDMPYADKLDEQIEKLADALVEFARRFAADPIPVDTHSSRILWVKPQNLPVGRIPVYLRPTSKNTPPRWTIEFDPSTRVALLLDGDSIVKPYAGTLTEVLVQASRNLWDIDY
jgi:hypothetical protein